VIITSSIFRTSDDLAVSEIGVSVHLNHTANDTITLAHYYTTLTADSSNNILFLFPHKSCFQFLSFPHSSTTGATAASLVTVQRHTEFKLAIRIHNVQHGPSPQCAYYAGSHRQIQS